MQNLLISTGEEITPQMRSGFPQKFTNPFSYLPDDLCRCAASQVMAYLEEKPQWHSELQQGKMFGVLVVETPDGKLGFLAAFSGNLQGQNNLEYFVPPVYDLLSPDEFFKVGEREISGINALIARLEAGDELVVVKSELARVRKKFEGEIQKLKRIYKEGKAERERLRGEEANPQLLAQITRESQFQKAEIKRAERAFKEALQPLEERVKGLEREIEKLKELRKVKSAVLQEEIFRQFSFLNGYGQRRDMLDIFADFYKEQALRRGRPVLPPGGAGECAAPKLLQYAFLHGMRPISMGEFWWGDSPRGEVRRHGEFYPSCKGKCAPILSFMLQGLPVEAELFHTSYGSSGEMEILYSDDKILAVNKPAGVLSVSGKEEIGQKSVQELLAISSSLCTETSCMGEAAIIPVHRLDMHTSGVLLLARDEKVYKELQSQFARCSVRKCYRAVLDGVAAPENCGAGVNWESSVSGTISLPLVADYDHRPAQKVDFGEGKEAVTRFEITAVQNGRTFVNFYPVTGRTHQLRVHSAHKMGLNTPIVGDLLYGSPSQRLMLHAHWVEFIHPEKGVMKITAPLPEGFLE